MMQQLANFIVDHDPMMILRRTYDTVRYIRRAWNKDHAHPIDEEALRLFLCDEHYGDLTDEQRAVARQGRDEMRNVYGTVILHMLLCNEWCAAAWCRTAVPTAACSARKGGMRHGCLTGRDNRKSDRFAADERKAGGMTENQTDL